MGRNAKAGQLVNIGSDFGESRPGLGWRNCERQKVGGEAENIFLVLPVFGGGAACPRGIMPFRRLPSPPWVNFSFDAAIQFIE